MPLSHKERQQINTLVARFEADTGVEAVAAVTGKADAYPEIPWKAYAMGSALAALAAAFAPPPITDWTQSGLIAFDAMLILAAGAVLSILAALVPGIGRVFLDRTRAHNEARQYAQSMFLKRELFGTAQRRAVLILMCRFERIAVVMTDTGLAPYAPPSELNEIGSSAAALLARGDLVAAFETAFDRVKALLYLRGLSAERLERNALDDDVVMEKSA